MPTYKLTIEYDGTRYSGWQTQANTPRTVQGRLAAAATQLFGKHDLGGSGRTDAGVHAAAQVAHLRIDQSVRPLELSRSLNDLLPFDIHILEARKMKGAFHARHDAVSRSYLYQISTRRTAFAKSFVWWIRDPLDVETMNLAAARLIGRHDFAAFADRRNRSESTIVVVEDCRVVRAGDLLLVRITASHFLWKMVRKLVAALVEVGRGTMTPDSLAGMLSPGADLFRPTAPPSGLFLEAVIYENEKTARPLVPIIPVTPFDSP